MFPPHRKRWGFHKTVYVITTSQNPYYVAVSFDNENGDVILEFDIVDANKSYKTFDDVKKEIEEILNI